MLFQLPEHEAHVVSAVRAAPPRTEAVLHLVRQGFRDERKWVVPQWEVLAAGRVGWDGGLKKVRVNESRGNSGEQE
jgi:hypothetical protein